MSVTRILPRSTLAGNEVPTLRGHRSSSTHRASDPHGRPLLPPVERALSGCTDRGVMLRTDGDSSILVPMTGVEEVLLELAQSNYRGAVFLLAYGTTWLVCAALWRITKPKYAVLATLFQGMVALPVALGVSAWLGMFEARPGAETITQLGVLISVSQLLVLPLLIVLTVRGRYTMVPLLFSLAGAVHFVPYAWLYQSLLYILLPIVLAVGLAVLYGTDRAAADGDSMSAAAAGRVCALTGAALLVTGGLAIAAPI